MNTFSKAYIPYGGYYSSPFCRWQGSMQNENAIELGAKTARRWFLEKKKIDPAVIDYLYFGITIHQLHIFYGHNWAAGMLVDNKKDLPGLMIQQACTTSTTILNLAALAVEQGAFEVGFCLMTDRCSNGAHTVWPNPIGTRRRGDRRELDDGQFQLRSQRHPAAQNGADRRKRGQRMWELAKEEVDAVVVQTIRAVPHGSGK